MFLGQLCQPSNFRYLICSITCWLLYKEICLPHPQMCQFLPENNVLHILRMFYFSIVKLSQNAGIKLIHTDVVLRSRHDFMMVQECTGITPVNFY